MLTNVIFVYFLTFFPNLCQIQQIAEAETVNPLPAKGVVRTPPSGRIVNVHKQLYIDIYYISAIYLCVDGLLVHCDSESLTCACGGVRGFG